MQCHLYQFDVLLIFVIINHVTLCENVHLINLYYAIIIANFNKTDINKCNVSCPCLLYAIREFKLKRIIFFTTSRGQQRHHNLCFIFNLSHILFIFTIKNKVEINRSRGMSFILTIINFMFVICIIIN